MSFLSEGSIEMPCPDSMTVRSCMGKVQITIVFHRVARGRGAFTSSIDESEICECNRCGRRFKYAGIISTTPNLTFFDTMKSGGFKVGDIVIPSDPRKSKKFLRLCGVGSRLNNFIGERCKVDYLHRNGTIRIWRIGGGPDYVMDWTRSYLRKRKT